MAGSLPGGNSMSTTGPVMAMTWPTARSVSDFLGAATAMAVRYLSVSAARQDAFAPVAISIISRVMLVWRTLL